MAYRYLCKACGAIYYSASPPEFHREKNCPNCGGELACFSERPRLGEILVAMGILNSLHLQIALRLQASLKKKIQIGKILLKLGVISPSDLLRALEIQRRFS